MLIEIIYLAYRYIAKKIDYLCAVFVIVSEVSGKSVLYNSIIKLFTELKFCREN